MEIKALMQRMLELNGSDLFYRAGGPARLRIDGRVVPQGDKNLTLEEVIKAVEAITTPKQKEIFRQELDVDFAIYSKELGHRFRVSIFTQRNAPSIVIRNIRSEIHNFQDLNLPSAIMQKLALETRGMVLLTGSAGSGKSTTIASMIEYINANCNKHILTVEEPIEFTFKDKKAIINQRELGIDVSSYAVALRAFTLQSPDVIFIGNIRDYDTMAAVMTVAETGALVLSTLHTVNASQTIERIVNFFPPYQHQEVRSRLASLLKGVISLRLVPLKSGAGRIPAYEVMLQTPTVSRLIREDKVYEIPKFIEEGAVFGMQSFSQSLIKLVKEERISEEEAVSFADNRDEFLLSLRGIRRS